MAKIKFDVTSSDPDKAGGANFEDPKPGVYRAKVKEVNQTYAKNRDTGKPDKDRPMLEVVFAFEEAKYGNIWDYITFTEASAWKMDQFLQAFGVASSKKRKGTFDTDDIVGSSCKLRVKADSYNGEYRARVGAVIPLLEDDDLVDDDEEYDEPEEDDYDEDEEEELEEDDDEEDEEEEESGYDDMSIKALKAELQARELKTTGKREALIERLVEDDEEMPF